VPERSTVIMRFAVAFVEPEGGSFPGLGGHRHMHNAKAFEIS